VVDRAVTMASFNPPSGRRSIYYLLKGYTILSASAWWLSHGDFNTTNK
jgi:hypothetical protein